MSKILKKTLATVSLGLVCTSLGVTMAFTANAATGEGRYSGGSCSSASAACYHGAGWVRYKYTNNYDDDENPPKAIVPNARSWWDENRLVKIRNKCRDYEGFYALVRFETASGSGNWTGYGATSTQVKHVRWQSVNNVKQEDKPGHSFYIFWPNSQSDTSPYESDLGIEFKDSTEHSWSKPLRAKSDEAVANPTGPLTAFKAYKKMVPDENAFGRDGDGKLIQWNSPNSEIGWFCYGTSYVKGRFYSRARVVDPGPTVSTETDSSRWYNGGENYSKERAIELDTNQESKDITFSFVIGIRTTQRKHGKFKDAGAYTKWKVTQADNEDMKSSKQVIGETKASLADGIEKVSGSYDEDTDSYVWNKVVGKNTVNVKVGRGQTKTVCQQIEYKTKNFKVYDDSTFQPDNNTKSSKICVKLHRPDPQGDPGSFYSQSSVGEQTTGKDENWGASDSRIKTIEMDADQASQTVTFAHRIGSDVDNNIYSKASYANASTTWTVSQSGYNSNGNVANGTTRMADLNQEGSTHVSTVNTNSVTVFVAQNSTVTICQTIRYQTKNFTIRTMNNFAGFNPNNDSGSSTICIKLHRPQIIHYCTQIFSDALSTANYGNTLARSQVINQTSHSPWKGEVYAKPGDEIQFRHALCFGDQAVTGSGRDGYGLDQYTTARKRASSFNDNIFPPNEFYLSGYSNSDYLFNRSDLTSTQTLRQNEKGLAKPTSFYDRFKPEEIFNDYGFQLYSPKNQSTGGFNWTDNLNSYKGFGCAPGVDGWGVGGLGLGNAYRIPGFAYDKKCQQQYGGIESSNAGQELSQTLHYRKIDAWKAYVHDKDNADCGNRNNCTSYRDREAVCDYNSTGNSSCDYSYLAPRYNNISNVHLGSVGEAYNYRGWKWGYLEQECDSQRCENSGWQISWTTKKDEDGYEYDDNYKATLYTNCSLGYHSGSKTSYSWDCTPNEKSVPKLKYNAPGRAGNSATYPIRFDDYWTETSAKVKVPYNFVTTAKATIRENSIVYAGESARSSFTVEAKPRLNPSVDANKPYLTMTPRNTVVRFISFIVDKDYDAGSGEALKGGIAPFPSNGQWGNNDVVSYYRSRLGSHMIGNPELLYSDSPRAINPDGELYSSSVEAAGSGNTIYQNIPDVEPGSKYCVAVGVWHADSHGITSKTNLSVGEVEGVNRYALDGASPYWRISSASCRTIAKKPNFQAWGGFYTQGKLITSQSNKTRIDKIFGSWSDTLAIVGWESKGFASGATLGYIDTGGAPKNTKYCNLVPMTIANNQCRSNTNTDTVGSAGSVPATGLLSQIRNRYTPGDKSAVGRSYYSTYLNSDEVFYEYYKTSTYINLGTIIQNQRPGDKGKTRVIEIDGDVRINGNICVGSGTCSSTGYNVLSLQSRNSAGYQGGGDIPQVIIIANNITISPEVTQIDAWLFARGSTGNENQANFGTVNTCADNPSSADVCNKTIIFNGPVFARKLLLNRTAGAYPGVNSIGKIKYDADLANTGSITPAEIFNLRSDVYYWAYNQANRLSQATVVYMRELAPRF